MSKVPARQRELTRARADKALISERTTGYGRDLALLRQAIKLLTEAVAREIDDYPWKSLKRDLLTRASRLPLSWHLDAYALKASSPDLAKLNQELCVLLQDHRIRPNPGQLEALEKIGAELAAHLVEIYRLSPGEAPELEALLRRSHDAH